MRKKSRSNGKEIEMRIDRLSGKYRYPYIYVIVKNNYIYIGETQLHPSVRWASHFKVNGSFSKNLRKINEEIYLEPIEMFTFSMKCDEIVMKYSQAEYKNATQYLEHQLHILFSINKNLFVENLIIISNTDKTLPKYPYRFKDMKGYAKLIFENLVIELNDII